MDLSSIEIFLAVAADHSVTKAAKAVGRVPSNVTTRVQLLEEELGVCLFSRDGKKMTLTREGEIFLAYANRLMALSLEARQAVRPLAPSGTLRVGTMESTAASWLPAALAQFNQIWPSVSVSLTMGASRELARDVRADALDCALIARPPNTITEADKQSDAGLDALEMEAVFTEDLLLVLPPGHPPIKIAADLRVGSLAALEPGCTYRRIAENWARGSSELPTIELASYHAILASVATGNAVGVMPRSVLDQMPLPTSMNTYELGSVDTLLIYRKNGCSSAFDAFHEVLRTTKGRDPRRSTN
ncbi:LysR substrate-binding domain-containing protein [Rhizobium mayense]|uniref:LysR substrate-binding domain-containing protein n=1 Tax=Rhizobium mayense TaxID=1312184 RepID=A0ABT7K8F8_9HYPH|nr:LysR substrate-binding domain-containing protein [Rhizobium mayense]MDL2403429.1 LysR substrate-binding domain-containing protein [Rhizobium mayense]